MSSVFKILHKIKNFCVKYWKLILGLAVFLVGFILGRRKSKDVNPLEQDDLQSANKALVEQLDAVESINKQHGDDLGKLIQNNKEEIQKIASTKKENFEVLSNDNEKLDKILNEKHDLKKGE